MAKVLLLIVLVFSVSPVPSVASLSPTAAEAQGTAPGTDSGPSISVADTSVAERFSGLTHATFTVTLSTRTRRPMRVSYATSDDSARSGLDYTPTTGSVVIPTGQDQGVIEVPVNGDTQPEPDETFMLTLTGAEGGSVVRPAAKGTILDARPGVSISPTSVVEGNEVFITARFKVVQNGSGGRVSLSYTTEEGRATDGPDYLGQAAVFSFPAGQAEGTIEVDVTSDDTPEPIEEFKLVFESAGLARRQATGTIIDDDGPLPRPPVARAVAPPSPPPPQPQPPAVQQVPQPQPVAQAQVQLQAQSQGQLQAQTQAQAVIQVQQQGQAQLQTAMMTERSRELALERANVHAHLPRTPRSYLAGSRRRGPQPALVIMWLATALAPGVVIACRRNQAGAARASLLLVPPADVLGPESGRRRRRRPDPRQQRLER